jgi:hypothetical protein
MFFNIKNAVQGELVDTTQPTATVEPPTPLLSLGADGVRTPEAETDGAPKDLLSCIKEADRERAMRERIDLTTIEEDSEEESSPEVKGENLTGGPAQCGLCLPATPPEQTGECDPNWGSDSDTVWRAQSQSGDPWYTHGIYVLCKNSKPIQYFNYKCLALRRMRDEARDMCLLDVNYNYRVIHCSDTHIQVVRTHKWWLVAYDDVVGDWTIYRVYKKNNR